jgi:perosamine synthetase
MKEKITDKTKVIICQNTYGLSSNLEKIEEVAKEHNLYTLEDCTHGFGGYYNGKPNGTSCDASFFSTQWSKPYTTGVGGFCVVHDEKLRAKLADVNKELVDPSRKECLELKLMYFVRTYIINDITYWPMIRLYRWLSRRNLVVGSSSGEEVEGTKMPDGFFKKQSAVQFKKGIKSLKKLDDVNKLRRKNAEKYTAVLKELGKTYVDESLFDNHIFIRYPLLVKDREQFRELAEKEGIILGEWFESPIYPAYNSYNVWSLKVEELPNAMWVCERMVNLETTEKKVEKVLEFLKKHAEYLV